MEAKFSLLAEIDNNVQTIASQVSATDLDEVLRKVIANNSSFRVDRYRLGRCTFDRQFDSFQ